MARSLLPRVPLRPFLNTEPPSRSPAVSGCETKFLAQALLQSHPSPLQNIWHSTPASHFCPSGRNNVVQGPKCSPNAMAGPHHGPQATSSLQWALESFLSGRIYGGTKEPLFSKLLWLLSRPVAQVSHAVPIPQLALSLCLRGHRCYSTPCSFSDATLPVFFRLACFSVNMNLSSSWGDQSKW